MYVSKGKVGALWHDRRFCVWLGFFPSKLHASFHSRSSRQQLLSGKAELRVINS